jgi:hypothetical protein
LAFELAAVRTFASSPAIGSPSPPLLEEERHAGCLALKLHVLDPFGLHWPGFGAALAADDNPMDAAKIEFADILQEWLNGEEPYPCVNAAEMRNPWHAILSVLH